MPAPPPFQPELEALEFPVVADLVAGFARTRAGGGALASIHPWDGRGPVRRLRQMDRAGVER